MMSSPELLKNSGLAAFGERGAQSDVGNDYQFERGETDSEDEVKVNSEGESEHGEIGSEDEFKSGNESKHRGTDSEDEFQHFESSGQLQIQPDSTKILSDFTLFPKLTIELRLKIWKTAAFIARNVDIRGKDIEAVVWDEGRSDLHDLHSYTAPPSLLHVSKEARSEALKYYQLEFGTTCKYKLSPLGPDVTISTPPRIYINWAVDRICVFDTESFLDLVESPLVNSRFHKFIERCCEMKVRSLAWNCAWVYDKSGDMLPEFLLSRAETIDEVIIFLSYQYISIVAKVFNVRGFEFENLQKLEWDAMKEVVENHLAEWGSYDLSSLATLSKVRFCKVHIPIKPT